MKTFAKLASVEQARDWFSPKTISKIAQMCTQCCLQNSQQKSLSPSPQVMVYHWWSWARVRDVTVGAVVAPCL